MKTALVMLPLFAAASAALVVACSDASDVSVVGAGASSGYVGGTSGRPKRGTSSGYDDGTSGYTTPGYPYGTSSSGYDYGETSSSSGVIGTSQPIDVSRTLSFEVTIDSCSKAPGVCDDAQSFVVDFKTAALTTITCVEVAGHDGGTGGTQDAKTTKTLTADQVQTLRKQLGEIKTTSFEVSDGGGSQNIKSLEVTYNDGSKGTYSTYDTSCVPAQRRVADGATWQALYDTIRTM